MSNYLKIIFKCDFFCKYFLYFRGGTIFRRNNVLSKKEFVFGEKEFIPDSDLVLFLELIYLLFFNRD